MQVIPPWCGAAALVLIFIVAGAHAAELPNHHSKTHISMIQARAKAGTHRRLTTNLRLGMQSEMDGATSVDFVGQNLGLDDMSDDDDDDDDDDDKKADAEEEKADKEAEAVLEKEEAAALLAAQKKKRLAEIDIAAFKDDKAFDMKIDAEVDMMTNETQAPTLSSFLGALRTEMRMYSKPEYPAYLEAKLVAADQRVAELQEELGQKPSTNDAAGASNATKDAKKKETAKEKSPEKKALKAEEITGPAEEATAKDVAQKASETWAISFFAEVALLSMLFAMASASNTLVRSYTWFLIDQVIAIFLAVMYFQAFDSLFDFSSMATHNEVLSSVLHAVVMLAMVLTLAYLLRKNDLALAILCGAGAHVVSFSSIHAAATVQNKVWLNWSFTTEMCIFGILVLGLALATIGYLVYTAKKKNDLLDNDSFMDKTDDLENDFGAMATSVLFSMFMRFVLTGHHPVDDDTDFDHTREQRVRMFVYACVSLLVAGFVVTFCAKKSAESNSYATKRLMAFFTTVASMNVAWAFLYWAEWEFFEVLFPGEAIKGRVMFAILATVVGGLALIGLAKIGQGKGGVAGKSEKLVALTAISLVIAWSWEVCFDAAVEDMCEGVSHPVGWKIGATLTMFALVIPVYAFYVKPACNRNGEAGG